MTVRRRLVAGLPKQRSWFLYSYLSQANIHVTDDRVGSWTDCQSIYRDSATATRSTGVHSQTDDCCCCCCACCFPTSPPRSRSASDRTECRTFAPHRTSAPLHHERLGQRSFSVHGPVLWNRLPTSIRNTVAELFPSRTEDVLLPLSLSTGSDALVVVFGYKNKHQIYELN